MTYSLKSLNRLNPSLHGTKGSEVLPEYYTSDYPKLIEFIDEYYNFLDSDEQFNFLDIINDLNLSRDASSIDSKYIDQIIAEIGNGLTQGTFFSNPRLMIELLPKFYQVKGTRVGTEAFFRAFFNEDVVIEYPKDQMFIVGESKIGYESIKFIQNARQYQVFSILLKLGLNTIVYEELYKKFAHPAGFHFLGVIQTQTEVDLTLETDTVNWEDSAENILRIFAVNDVELGLTPQFEPTTAIIYDTPESGHRVSLTELISEYQNLTFTQLLEFYDTIENWYEANSYTFDDSSSNRGPDMSMSFETMDNDWYTRIGSDSVY